MSKRFVLVIVVCLLVLIGIFVVNKPKSSAPGTNNSSQATNHVEGTSPKGVTLLEYGDYECPYCKGYYPTVKEVAAKYKDSVVFQFRNLPLTSIHKNAFAGARAAEAASLQGKFWEMHDMLYDNQDPNGQTGWVASGDPLSYFTVFAQQLGLNVDKFKQDYAGSTVNDAINADLAAFNKTGQQEATPTFFLDGKYINDTKLQDASGPSLAKFSSLIDAELASKK